MTHVDGLHEPVNPSSCALEHADPPAREHVAVADVLSAGARGGDMRHFLSRKLDGEELALGCRVGVALEHIRHGHRLKEVKVVLLERLLAGWRDANVRGEGRHVVAQVGEATHVVEQGDVLEEAREGSTIAEDVAPVDAENRVAVRERRETHCELRGVRAGDEEVVTERRDVRAQRLLDHVLVCIWVLVGRGLRRVGDRGRSEGDLLVSG